MPLNKSDKGAKFETLKPFCLLFGTGMWKDFHQNAQLMSWCLMSSDVIWHIRDKLWPMPKHGSIKATYVRCMRVLAVTCHLHFWQNDRDFLRATVVTRGWNGYRNKSQHRKSTLEKKILPPFQQGFEPATFQSRIRRSNHWAIPAPKTHSIESRCVIGPENTLFAGVCMHLSARKFYRLGHWRG